MRIHQVVPELIDCDPPLSVSEIQTIEAQLGFALPNEFREHLQVYNGGWFKPATVMIVDDEEFSLHSFRPFGLDRPPSLLYTEFGMGVEIAFSPYNDKFALVCSGNRAGAIVYCGSGDEVVIAENLRQFFYLQRVQHRLVVSNETDPVFQLAESGNLEELRRVANEGDVVSLTNARGESLLFPAIRNHQLGMIRYLLSVGIDVSGMGNGGLAAVHLALESQSIDLLRIVLDADVDIEQRTLDGQTPLLFAFSVSNSTGVVELIRRGANVHVEDDAGYTPLSYDLRGNERLLIQQLLKERGVG